MPEADGVEEVDPFDLPDWLGAGQVTWRARSGVRDAYRIEGDLLGELEGALPCDLVAADRAYPRPVVEEPWRRRAHQQWTHGQVLLLRRDGRLTLTVPGVDFTADGVLDSLARLAKAVGAPPERFAATLRL